MSTKQSVFIATSVDGYIARLNGDIDWLSEYEPEAGEDYGFQEFMDSVDALVLGRNSFEKVLSFGKWPYGSKKVVVLSSSSPVIPSHVPDDVKVLSGAPQEIVEQLSREGFSHLYIDGGNTIQRFLNAGLIQEIIITRIPVLIGDGIPLFGPVEKDIKLQLISTHSYKNGLVQHRYVVKHDVNK